MTRPQHDHCSNSIQCTQHLCGWIYTISHSWFQTFIMFWMLCSFFWVNPRRLNFYMPTFRNSQFHLHRRCKHLWRWNRCVPKRRHIKIQTPGNHQKKIQRYIIFTFVISPRSSNIFVCTLLSTPVIYIVLKNCDLQDITSLFKLHRNQAMCFSKFAGRTQWQPYLCDQVGPLECRSGIGSIR